jgi:hypothetical protein
MYVFLSLTTMEYSMLSTLYCVLTFLFRSKLSKQLSINRWNYNKPYTTIIQYMSLKHKEKYV